MINKKFNIEDEVYIVIDGKIYEVIITDINPANDSTSEEKYYTVTVEINENGDSLELDETEVFTSEKEAEEAIYEIQDWFTKKCGINFNNS